MKKRIARMLKRVSEKQVNVDYLDPEARKMMYRPYYRQMKKEYLKMTPVDQVSLQRENIRYL